MDYSEIKNLKLIVNELELVGINLELEVLSRAIYNGEIVYVLKKDPFKVYSQKTGKVYDVKSKKELIPYPHLDEIILLLPFRSYANKIEGFLNFVRQKGFQQDLVILALNYLLCVKKNSVGINGILIDCYKKKDITKKIKSKK